MGHANFALATCAVEIWGNEDLRKIMYIGTSCMSFPQFPDKNDFYINHFKHLSLCLAESKHSEVI